MQARKNQREIPVRQCVHAEKKLQFGQCCRIHKSQLKWTDQGNAELTADMYLCHLFVHAQPLCVKSIQSNARRSSHAASIYVYFISKRFLLTASARGVNDVSMWHDSWRSTSVPSVMLDVCVSNSQQLS